MMIFEAFDADKGDCLLLRCGTALVLVDGGPAGTWSGRLRPALADMARDMDGPVRIAMGMVSHVDDDHIRGMLDLFADEARRREEKSAPLVTFKKFWHNHFDDIVGGMPADHSADPATIASIRQGQELVNALRVSHGLGNPPFSGLITAGAQRDFIDIGDGTTVTVAGPLAARLGELRDDWQAHLREEAVSVVGAEAARLVDYGATTDTNRSSIVALVRRAGSSILLTGDARGDDILEGLSMAGVPLPIAVDILKMPHHGARHAVTDGFFAQVTARHYVFSFSANGTHGHPDDETIRALVESRGPDDEYSLHFTNSHTRVRGTVEALKAGRRFDAVFRDKDKPSIRIALG
ncbi:MAG: hypothetical protein HQL39_11950 [Alphaproteobacteria bacterium]|nr:hypothetical protein [Alphaproteobacteria bacterium]